MKIGRMRLLPHMLTVVVLIIYLSYGKTDNVNGQYYNTGVNLNREIRMCGPLLTNTLELVCQGRFNSMMKKSEATSTHAQDYTRDKDSYSMFPFRSKRSPIPYNRQAPFRRRPRNVADECCYLKACTLAEMSNYCERN